MRLEELQLQILMILKGTLPNLFYIHIANSRTITTSDQVVTIISSENRVATPQHYSFKKEKILVSKVGYWN